MGYELVDVTTRDDWVAYHDIRRQELFEARGRYGVYNPEYPGERLPGMYALLLKLDGRPLGTTRLDIRDDGTAVFRLVAVTAAEQGKGHGRMLGQLVEARARALGATTLFVNAAITAMGYYENAGWRPYVWDEAEHASLGTECVQMRKQV